MGASCCASLVGLGGAGKRLTRAVEGACGDLDEVGRWDGSGEKWKELAALAAAAPTVLLVPCLGNKAEAGQADGVG